MLLLSVSSILLLAVLIKRKLSKPDLLLYTFYVAFLLGTPGSYLTLHSYNWWIRDVSEDSLYLAFDLFHLSLILMGLFCFFHRGQQLKRSVSTTNQRLMIQIVFAVLCVSLLLALVFLFPSSALKALIFDSDYSTLLLAELRGNMTGGQGIPKLVIYYKNIIIRYFLPFSMIYASLLYFHTGKYKGFYYFALFVTLFCLGLDLSKAPLLKIFIILAVCRYTAGKLSFAKGVRVATISAVIIFVLYSLVMGIESSSVVSEVAHRIFVVQYVGLPITIELFSQPDDYLDFGSSVGILSKLFNVDFAFFSRATMTFANPTGVEKGTAGFLSTFAPAEGYSIAGTTGFFVTTFVIILFLSFLDKAFSNRNSIEWFSFYILLLTGFPLLIMDSATSLLVNFGFLFVFLFLLIVGLISTNHEKRKRTQIKIISKTTI